MTRTAIAGEAFAIVLVLLVLVVLLTGHGTREQDVDRAAISPATAPSTAAADAEADRSFIYGRVTTVIGETYEGRLRWGGDQEAFWGDYFNGSKHENPWRAQVPPERLPKERSSFEVFGIKIAQRESPIDLHRPFMSRFGDIARMEARDRDVRVTLKSGTAFDLDRFEASDFDDGVRVWDGKKGVVDLDSRRIRAIELLPNPSPGAASHRLHGTVHTRHGDFTGFVQWAREQCVGSDELDGRTAEGKLRLRFDTIRSIARGLRDSSRVTLLDGREIVLDGTPDVGLGNRGIYVDDPRYGRVLISWFAFERVDFSPGGSGPAYGDFPPGSPLMGRVTTRDGRHLAGRLVYDLDESETTETLDAPSERVEYTIPFGMIASIVPLGRGERDVQGARVTLQSGEELMLESEGDLGDRNAGILIFVEGVERPEYVLWGDVAQVELGTFPTP